MPLPIKNGKITTAYKKLGKHWSNGYHTGVDFAVPVGTPVLAVADGFITNASWGADYGIHVVQRVAKGYVIYAHLNAKRVKQLQIVKAGQIIGESVTQAIPQAHTYTLNTGITSNGPRARI